MNRYPSAGGVYTFVRNVLGSDYGFLISWFMCLAYLSVLWANATSLPRFASIFCGDLFKVGFLHTVFGYDVYVGEIMLTGLAVISMYVLCGGPKRIFEGLMLFLALVFCVGIAVCFVGCMCLSVQEDTLAIGASSVWTLCPLGLVPYGHVVHNRA